MVQSSEGRRLNFQRAIDLGCGTGLAGKEFRLISKRLVGVDISSKMIKEASKKGIYDLLFSGEILTHLEKFNKNYDLVIASDVFIYFGTLEPVFRAVKNRIQKGGCFTFSTETCSKHSYVLRTSGRFAHSNRYIKNLAKKFEFEIRKTKNVKLRKEKNNWIQGDLYVLRCL
jgi:predicted TPR repeat methyltransferase